MELETVNATRFKVQAVALPGLTPSRTWTVMVKAVCDVGKDGISTASDEQLPLVGADVAGDDPAQAVLYESDFVPFKAKADVLCAGKAYAPGGIPVTECLISFGVGTLNKTIRVIGDRQWKPVLGRFLAFKGRPKPFQSMVVSYDNAYGGKDAGKPDGFRTYAFNPVGKGYSRRGGGLKGLALPNLEDPKRRIGSWRNRPTPVSFGPVGRTWEPRIRYAGNYDKKWLKNRSPLLPEDFNEAFYNCAPEDQQMPGYLRGDEEVRVQNMHRQHPDFRCHLPGVRIRALLDRKMGTSNELEDITMNLDTLWVDMEALKLVLVWRGRIAAAKASEGGTVLIVEEPLDTARRPAESYRSELLKHAAEEQEAERTIEETEKELEKLEAERNPA
jgi:hypothetical protein